MPLSRIPLPQLPRRLADLTGSTPPSYRQCYVAVLDAILPTDTINGRHYFYENDLPAIAGIFGLPVAPNAHLPATGRAYEHDDDHVASMVQLE